MPKKFTGNEKEFIAKRLKEEAMKCICIYGIKKTTVDELVKRVNIPKGTFYLFYGSKELLLFDAINDIQNEMQSKLLQMIGGFMNELTVDRLTDLLMLMIQEVNNTGLLPIMLNGEMDYLMRKLPEDMVRKHLEQDDMSMEKLFSFLPYKEGKNVEAFSAAFRGVFLTILYKREIGEKIFDEALKLMLRGLVIQMMEDNGHD